METWSFNCLHSDRNLELIMRRLPQVNNQDETRAETNYQPAFSQLHITDEAELIDCVGSHDIKVAKIILILQPEHQLGVGFIMTREPGEALPQKILRDPLFDKARETLAFQCGQELAKIHKIPLAQIPSRVPHLSINQQLDELQRKADRFGNVSPVHQLAIHWLKQNQPRNPQHCLVHGDFRNGNLLITEGGLSAVLDWELSHIGDPAEDLGYLCANVWRFGVSNKPVGGFGEYEQLLKGYESIAEFSPTIDELIYWQVYSALNWGLICLYMLEMYRTGQDRSIERAAIGRRMSESEIDLLNLLDEKFSSDAHSATGS